MKLSNREKQMLRNAGSNLRIRYNAHKAREPYKSWPKSVRNAHDRFCVSMSIPTMRF